MNAAPTWTRNDRTGKTARFTHAGRYYVLIAKAVTGTRNGRRYTAWQWHITERTADGAYVADVSEGTVWEKPMQGLNAAITAVLN